MSENTAGTFAPDWEALAKAGNNGYYHGGLAPGDFHDREVADFKRVAEAVIAEWNRQVAAAGYVMVRREDLLAWIDDEIDLAYEEGLLAVGDEGAEEWTQELRNYVKRLDAATPASAPGGDER